METTQRSPEEISSGFPALDEIIDRLRIGDNVVWRVDSLENYSILARAFADLALDHHRKLVYIRFAAHPLIMKPREGLLTLEVDPGLGFDSFCTQVSNIIDEHGPHTFYVFDNLSALVEDWATDELLANFFQVTCPYLREMKTIAYFALTRGQHSHVALSKIRSTTQVLMDVYYVQGHLYIQALKVLDRYSPQMFIPHKFHGTSLTPLSQSSEASVVLAHASRQPLRRKADSFVPWDEVYRKLAQFEESEITAPERIQERDALKMEFARMIIGSHPQFNRLADDYLTLQDLFDIRYRMIGSGRIGGKASGMLVARRILLDAPGEVNFGKVLEQHDSFYIGSDVFFSFLVNNGLFRLRMRLTRSSQITQEEFEEVERRFLVGKFPPEIMEQFQDMLEYFGQAPIIVRSSSLLEDGFGNAFAGKYRSEFCVNQDTPEQRMDDFLRAVKLVYASAVNPDALAYRRQRGLGESDEQMAILVQRVSGFNYKKFFFPQMAGVAFSHNLYRWTDRIDPLQGMVRLVFGLGTRAVDRVGGDYPRIIALSHPELRQEVGAKISAYSQRRVDVLDLSQNKFHTQRFNDLVAGGDYPGLHLFVSMVEHGYVRDPASALLKDLKNSVLTFNLLIRQTNFIQVMREMTAKLEKAYGYPVDTELTASIGADNEVRINLLQCRPMRLPGAKVPEDAMPPEDLRTQSVLFRTTRMIPGGVADKIRYILYIDPKAYANRASLEVKKSLGRVVGDLNRHAAFAKHRFIIAGPGRWGSSNINLGVNTSYADINNTSALVEIALETAGHTPELSYGTHFFLDLVESQIIYLPVYPDNPATQYNFTFFNSSPNILCEILPQASQYAEFIKVIDVHRATGGKYAKIVADSKNQKAVCFLDEGK
ncbi:PEP/pyruvate-binding domain-containing protein [Desulfatibacillum aliphaticivorans]|uniref:PEP/pyruvate-binding domain-containing protein n=1 Tax=Desulfatibacillum aliphaticivorans TaxID=218208 RepID=UPI0004051709|nr:PEP/pyruvate-binding domain-containing protein [Desulfatibacillum aliphaticivorans]